MVYSLQIFARNIVVQNIQKTVLWHAHIPHKYADSAHRVFGHGHARRIVPHTPRWLTSHTVCLVTVTCVALYHTHHVG
jgi:hypothetical protein